MLYNENNKFPALHEIAEMLYTEVQSEQLTVECTVFPVLGW